MPSVCLFTVPEVVWVAGCLDPILGKLGVWHIYTLNGMSFHFSQSTHRLFWEVSEKKPENLEETHMDTENIPRINPESVRQHCYPVPRHAAVAMN